jgi:hypothetical protein
MPFHRTHSMKYFVRIRQIWMQLQAKCVCKFCYYLSTRHFWSIGMYAIYTARKYTMYVVLTVTATEILVAV